MFIFNGENEIRMESVSANFVMFNYSALYFLEIKIFLFFINSPSFVNKIQQKINKYIW